MTLDIANGLAINLSALGQPERARELDEDTLDRSRRVLGADHPDTLATAHNLGNDLRGLGNSSRPANSTRTPATGCAVLGEDHHDTLGSASNLALDLHGLGDVRAGARAQRGHPAAVPRTAGRGPPANPADRAQPRRRPPRARRLRGPQQRSTKTSWTAANGHCARTTPTPWTPRTTWRPTSPHSATSKLAHLDQDTLTRRQRVLGESHPATLASAHNLALDEAAIADPDRPRRRPRFSMPVGRPGRSTTCPPSGDGQCPPPASRWPPVGMMITSGT